MWKRATIFIYGILLCAMTGAAADGGVEIKAVNKNTVNLTPGSTSNVVLMLINNADEDKEISLKVVTPKGWSKLNDYASIFLEKNSRKLKILSFHIAENTKVGDYTIDVTSFLKSESYVLEKIHIPVFIQPRYEITIQSLNTEKYVFTGDTMEAKFLIQNFSNTKVEILATISNANKQENKSFTLASDSSLITSVFTITEKEIEHYTSHSVSITAAVKDHIETEGQATYIFDVIPSNNAKFDKYNRIPVQISSLLVTNNQNGERLFGGMFDIKGAGMISKEKKRKIDFHFRGPNRQGNPILGQTDEYNVKYDSKHSSLILGDHSFRLTDLTEGSRSGRGVQYKHKFKKASFRSFVNFPRYFPNLNCVMAVFGSYRIGGKSVVNAGFLNKLFTKTGVAQLITLSGDLSPVSWGGLKFEYATGMFQGQTTNAYSGSIRSNFSKYRMFVNYTKAEPGFPGYMSNSEALLAGFKATFFKKLEFTLNYNFNHTNIALDTMFLNAPFSDNLGITVGYSINFNHRLSIGVNKRNIEDMATPKKFYYEEQTVRITFQSKIKKFAFNIYGAYGKSNNKLQAQIGELTNVVSASLSVVYQLSKKYYLRSFLTYQGAQQYLTPDYTSFFYGALLNANWNNKLTASFQYQNNYEVEDYYQDRSLLSLNSNYKINNKHEIGASVNYDLRKNSLNKTMLGASLKYTYTLNVPVSMREDIGKLKGTVINNGIKSVEGIVFTLDNNIAVTDKNGKFEFSFVKTGTHFLFMDNSKSGLFTIAETPGPYKIEIFPGEEFVFELSLTKSGIIEGHISIQEDENKDKRGYIAVKEKLGKLIIEANNGTETYRLFTQADGSFKFRDLRPGIWKIIVYDRGIPKNHVLVKKEYSLNLASGQTGKVRILIKKESRRIKFQKK
jgi:hypothetical protein